MKKGFYSEDVWGTLRFCIGQPGYWFSNIDFNFDTDFKFRKLNKNEKNNTKLSDNEFLFKKYIIPTIKNELKI